MEPWFDTHVHLDRYEFEERRALLKRAEAAGVAVFAIAVDLPSSREVVAMGGVRGKAVGMHPRNAEDGFEAELLDLASRPGVVAVGECGFDGERPDWKPQATTFESQCAIARRLERTLVLHIDGAGAWEHLLEHEAALEGQRVVRHYFTGDEAQAEWHAERGHYISFGNPLRREPALREIARSYPPDLLLIETDSYPLARRNTEPADVVKVGETMALLRDWTFDEARERLGANTRKAFRMV